MSHEEWGCKNIAFHSSSDSCRMINEDGVARGEGGWGRGRLSQVFGKFWINFGLGFIGEEIDLLYVRQPEYANIQFEC